MQRTTALKKLSTAALLFGLPGAYASGPRGFDGTGDARDLIGLIGREATWSASTFGPYGTQVWDAIQICGPFNMLPQGISWSDTQLRQLRIVSGLQTPLSLGPIDHPQAACVVKIARDTETKLRKTAAAAKAEAAARSAQEGDDALLFIGGVFVGIPALTGLVYGVDLGVQALMRRRAAKAPAPDLEMQVLSDNAAPPRPAPSASMIVSDALEPADSDSEDNNDIDLERQAQSGKRAKDANGRYTAAADTDDDALSNCSDSPASCLHD